MLRGSTKTLCNLSSVEHQPAGAPDFAVWSAPATL
jgi:hypothetical protein